MSGTPAKILMFFKGIPLLPPLARIKAATCRWSSGLTRLQAENCASTSSFLPRGHLFLEAMTALANQRAKEDNETDRERVLPEFDRKWGARCPKFNGPGLTT